MEIIKKACPTLRHAIFIPNHSDCSTQEANGQHTQWLSSHSAAIEIRGLGVK